MVSKPKDFPKLLGKKRLKICKNCGSMHFTHKWKEMVLGGKSFIYLGQPSGGFFF